MIGNFSFLIVEKAYLDIKLLTVETLTEILNDSRPM